MNEEGIKVSARPILVLTCFRLLLKIVFRSYFQKDQYIFREKLHNFEITFKNRFRHYLRKYQSSRKTTFSTLLLISLIHLSRILQANTYFTGVLMHKELTSFEDERCALWNSHSLQFTYFINFSFNYFQFKFNTLFLINRK